MNLLLLLLSDLYTINLSLSGSPKEIDSWRLKEWRVSSARANRLTAVCYSNLGDVLMLRFASLLFTVTKIKSLSVDVWADGSTECRFEPRFPPVFCPDSCGSPTAIVYSVTFRPPLMESGGRCHTAPHQRSSNHSDVDSVVLGVGSPSLSTPWDVNPRRYFSGVKMLFTAKTLTISGSGFTPR